MKPFQHVWAANERDAVEAVSRPGVTGRSAIAAPAQFLAGGTTLLDLMKLEVMRPERLVNIGALRRAASSGIEAGPQGLRLDPLTTMAELADHPVLQRDYPLIVDTLTLAASPQIRNMASLGGNLLQRTRCSYFRDVRWQECNKRNPGSGCAARSGINRQHAVLGGSTDCIATYPGDFAQALVAFDATVATLNSRGRRTIPVADLHRVPGTTPHVETVLAPGELITAIHVPAGPWTRRSRYVKIRDRASFQFAVVSAAVALHLDSGVVREARIALGGVATTPWRARKAESMLRGCRFDESLARTAAEYAFLESATSSHNAFKVPLGKATVVRALLEAAQMDA
ncbi:MAG: xanthine dehydrogenase family protein subunit M [Betaproteobacteria bacterium]